MNNHLNFRKHNIMRLDYNFFDFLFCVSFYQAVENKDNT